MVHTPLPRRLRKSLDQNELIQELEAPKFSQSINDAEWELIATRYKNKFPEDASLIEWQAIKKYIINKKIYIKSRQKHKGIPNSKSSEKTTQTQNITITQPLENPSHSVSPTQPAPPIRPSSPIPSTSTSDPKSAKPTTTHQSIPESDSQIPYLSKTEYKNFMDSL